MTKTQTIAGHTFTLNIGTRYVATRPMASLRNQKFPVTIKETNAPLVFPPNVTTKPLSYLAANRLVNAFNNGASSWDGRIW